MGLIEEVTKMQQGGMSDADIAAELQKKGVDRKQISEILSQSSIKNAVSSEQSSSTIPEYTKDSGMEQSVMNSQYGAEEYNNVQNTPKETEKYTDYAQFASPQQQQQAQEEPQYQQQDYNQYDSYQTSDNMSEIAEQIFDEKISSLTRKVESLQSFRTEIETKTQSIDQRLIRIEKMIDRLQLSILQKVGDYLTNVEDIKKELHQTQKSFKSIVKKDKQIP